MTQHYIQVPDALAMTRNPVGFRIATDSGPAVAIIVALYRVQGYALSKVYEERRKSVYDASLGYISAGASAGSFDFSAVLDDELSAKVPPAGGGNYTIPNVAGEFLALGNEVADDEVLATTITGTSVPSPAGFTFEVGKYYRLVADYNEDYSDGSNKLSDGTNEANIFVPDKTMLWGGELHFPFRAEHAFDTILTYINGWEIKVYEMPYRTFWALKGGWDYRLFPDRATPLPLGSYLLTTMPTARSFWLGQMAWIAFLVPGNSTYYREHTVYYTDGTSSTPVSASLGFLSENTAFAVDISDATLGYSLINPAKEIARIAMRIYQIGGMDHTVTLKAMFTHSPFRREFHYTNSLGGCDWLIAYGKGQHSEEHEAVEYENYVEAGYSLQSGPQFSAVRQRPRQAFQVSSGYRIRAERDAAKEILQAEKAFIREGDLLVPIIIEAGTVQDEPDGDYRHKISFTYRYAFKKLSV